MGIWLVSAVLAWGALSAPTHLKVVANYGQLFASKKECLSFLDANKEVAMEELILYSRGSEAPNAQIFQISCMTLGEIQSLDEAFDNRNKSKKR